MKEELSSYFGRGQLNMIISFKIEEKGGIKYIADGLIHVYESRNAKQWNK